MSELLVDTIRTSGGSGGLTVPSTAGTLITSNNFSDNLPSGSILQVQYTQFTGTNTVSQSAVTEALITDLAVSITPTSTSNLIKVEAMVCGEHGVTGNIFNTVWYFDRSGTKLAAPEAGSRKSGIAIGNTIGYDASNAASTPEMVNYTYFDTPSTTSSITYTVAMLSQSAQTWYLNRTVSDADSSSYERGISYISVTEIKA
jgi:hypothetical protein